MSYAFTAIIVGKMKFPGQSACRMPSRCQALDLRGHLQTQGPQVSWAVSLGQNTQVHVFTHM